MGGAQAGVTGIHRGVTRGPLRCAMEVQRDGVRGAKIGCVPHKGASGRSRARTRRYPSCPRARRWTPLQALAFCLWGQVVQIGTTRRSTGPAEDGSEDASATPGHLLLRPLGATGPTT
eukprot:558532-Prorocentrum_minimum.AAC.1